jgi:aconitate hydratase A / 2-methylisocitrate dehydratase
MADSFGARAKLRVGDQSFDFFRLSALEKAFPQSRRLPYSLKILLENLLRTEGNGSVRAADIEALAGIDLKKEPDREIAFSPARVLLQDFTGVPAVVDLAAMRDAMKAMGGDSGRISPLLPVELVIDHSVQVDEYGSPLAMKRNAELEFQRNSERYLFLNWGQKAFKNFSVVPPDTGIVHQVNLEHLARVVMSGGGLAYPDTLVGTDSHTTMVNGLGVLGWGCGGIEAEAAMLGQPVSMLIPQVLGVKLTGSLAEGATATDLVLTVTETLRKKGVVGKFVEYFGPGLATLPLADRATIANMAPEYGATCGIFPVDAETLRYLRLTGRPQATIELVEAYTKEQGLFHTSHSLDADYGDVLEIDLSKIVPSLAGPSRPQDRVPLTDAKKAFQDALRAQLAKMPTKVAPKSERSVERTPTPPPSSARSLSSPPPSSPSLARMVNEASNHLQHGSVVIAAITSCTNTSNPSVLMAAGLLAKKAVQRGLSTRPWVKTSLAPGSKVVTEYLTSSGLMSYLERLRFHLVGYGCTTCIGNSGPLPEPISRAIDESALTVCAVLSGNRNFEGRVHPEVRFNYLASPPLVVAYALAGRMDIDLLHDPLGNDQQGKPVFLKDVWPTRLEIEEEIHKCVRAEMFRGVYSHIFEGDERWRSLKAPEGERFRWDDSSTYVKHPPYFVGMSREPGAVGDVAKARVLAVLGDSITTDHISPAGSIKATSPAGEYLVAHGVEPKDFNSYGSRRGNHEVMVRGTFANVRLRNQLVPGVEGGMTRHLPDGKTMSIFDAAVAYEKEGVPLVILAGKEYGSGSSRDWAAKGPRLLGVRAVIAESYERIHRSNLVGMGVLPLQFAPGENAGKLGLDGEETYDIEGLKAAVASAASGQKATILVKATKNGSAREFKAIVRIDTPQEALYYEHGGILTYVLRQLASQKGAGANA